MSNLVQFPSSRYDGHTCSCGSAWFTATITLGTDLRPTGWHNPVCVDCDMPLSERFER